jgi:hypothetical protein
MVPDIPVDIVSSGFHNGDAGPGLRKHERRHSTSGTGSNNSDIIDLWHGSSLFFV